MPTPDRSELLAIFLGGCLGALARAGTAELLPTPWGTLAVNVAGAFLLGYVITRLQERMPLTLYRRPLLGTGFCGALTTFSTVQVELLDYLKDGRAATAAVYALGSVAFGYAALTLATGLARR